MSKGPQDLQLALQNAETTHTQQFFRRALMQWAAGTERPMPWKGERDPYKIWLSEIILQQTRVEQGLPYYEKFIAHFPTVTDLAAAPSDTVMKLWEGLGYYSRARNMHETARLITETYKGVFPDNYPAIRQLKGVGDYTAAAIASFAFGLPHAVLDGNVYRILARFFGVESATDTTEAKKVFARLANLLLDQEQPGLYNQAIMDFGAIHCTPQQPKCAVCPLATECQALRQNKVAQIPLKSKTLQKKTRYFLYLVCRFPDGLTLLNQRGEKDIWQGLYEFPLLELAQLPADNTTLRIILEHEVFQQAIPAEIELGSLSAPSRQVLTHQHIHAVFSEVHISRPAAEFVANTPFFAPFLLVKSADLKKKFAFPRVIDWFLTKTPVNLSLF